eukprot:288646-Amphidinium_carterae.1
MVRFTETQTCHFVHISGLPPPASQRHDRCKPLKGNPRKASLGIVGALGPPCNHRCLRPFLEFVLQGQHGCSCDSVPHRVRFVISIGSECDMCYPQFF